MAAAKTLNILEWQAPALMTLIITVVAAGVEMIGVGHLSIGADRDPDNIPPSGTFQIVACIGGVPLGRQSTH